MWRDSSLSTDRPCVPQSQMPFAAARRSALVRPASHRGPPREAAVMWAAAPTSDTPLARVSEGPTVGARQDGMEHLKATLLANCSLTSGGKSSRFTA